MHKHAVCQARADRRWLRNAAFLQGADALGAAMPDHLPPPEAAATRAGFALVSSRFVSFRGVVTQRRVPLEVAVPREMAASRRAGGRAPGLSIAVLLTLAFGSTVTACSGARPRAAVPLATPLVLEATSPSLHESYCAWYGDAREGVLYFGESPFWSAMRAAGGDPTADLRASGLQRIGRMDLTNLVLLDPLEASGPLGSPARSSVWDVLAHPNGRVYFTTYFESAGMVDPASGEAIRFEALGVGLNELVLGPGGSILATRYADGAGGSGSVVWFHPDGQPIAEHRLSGERGVVVAAKSLAYDASRGQIWVNTDLLGADGGRLGHDVRVLNANGRELARWREPEVQFMSFDAAGQGLVVERSGTRLALRIVPPGEGPSDGVPRRSGRVLLLDDAFPVGVDFAQDVKPSDDPGDRRYVVTRWSGRVHVVDPDAADAVRTLDLPRSTPDSLYYTGVLRGGRVCATECAAIRVVCAAAP